MPDSTAIVSFEEAKRCPKCHFPGDERKTSKAPQGGEIHYIWCVTAICPWYETSWVVQTRADGTIPLRDPHDKQFPVLSPDQLAFGQRIVEDAVKRDLRNEA